MAKRRIDVMGSGQGKKVMPQHRIINHSELRSEMMAVARSNIVVQPNTAAHSFETTEALMRLLTPENRQLLAIIRDQKPQSIAELAGFSGRAAPNLTRTLSKMEAAGFVRMDDDKRRKVPIAIVNKLIVEIDPFSQNDRVEIA